MTISGANFSQAGPSDLAVKFGMRRLVPASLISSTLLEAFLPPLPAGVARLDVSSNRLDFIRTTVSLRVSCPYIVRGTPCTLHPAPYTLHPIPYTLHPTPFTLHPTPYTLQPAP